jgi:hypothetical protein
MKTFKLVLVSVVALFIVLIVVQNLSVFTHKEPLGLNLLVWKYQSGDILLSMYFVAFFLMGLLLSYFHGLSGRFKAKNEARDLLDTIYKLEEEIKVLKGLSPQQENPPTTETESA